MAAGGIRILALLTDAYGGFGGIALYNRDLLAAWAGDPAVSEIVAVPRLAASPYGDVPAKVEHDLSGLASGGAYIRAALRRLSQPFDLVYCSHVNLAPLAYLLARAKRIPWLLQIYGVEAWQESPRLVTRYAARCADLVFSISEVTTARFCAATGVSAERLVQTPLALNQSKYGTGPRSDLLLDRYGLRDSKVLMTFGRMAAAERYKGFDEIIELLPRLAAREPRIAYLAAGDGDDRPRLERKARDLGVANRVVFTGRVIEAEKADTYRLADAYVMPSSGEGFGFVILEAMACGVPAIASETDGGREAVRGGKLGQLVRPDDAEGILRAIETALAQPREVPAGLDFFDVPNFEGRTRAGLHRVLGART